mmetsp:Transcript_4250/g.12021  ORF Transcript_4250/g.12021 Transcript_4250/m.12021 type:complete len:222 (-) Transcript_4250:1158-1823(-)
MLTVVPLRDEGRSTMSATTTIEALERSSCSLRRGNSVSKGNKVRVVVHEIACRAIWIELRHVVVLGFSVPQERIHSVGKALGEVTKGGGPSRVAKHLFGVSELLHEAHDHAVGVRCETRSNEHVDHQGARRTEEPHTLVKHAEEESTRLPNLGHIGFEPGHVASGLHVVQARQHPEDVGARLRRATDGLKRWRDAHEMMRQLAFAVDEAARAFQHKPHLLL